MKEVHLFLLWENARNKEKEILEDIKKEFNIIGLYNIKWKKETFSQNLSRFYGTNLPKNSGKEQHCGNGDFLLVIVEVENPKYEERETSKGKQIVNTNMFDKKNYYREMTGGGHKVHATNSEIETNHDLTLLLGKNINDYVKDLDTQKEIKMITLEQELAGYEGFDTVQEMFYVLNNCINYAIIRNYETLPEEIYVNEHNDIDIICDSYENAAYILNAEKVFKEEYRVHYKVKVEGKYAFFDLRYIGDQYYDYQMEKDILTNRIYNEKGFFTISDTDYFYGLIYHALLHKPRFSDDYNNRLQKMNFTNVRLHTQEDFIKILNKWLLNKGYHITKPIDKSVQFNLENAQKFDQILLDSGIEQGGIIMLQALRKNIISWYPFEKDAKILEIDSDCDQITEELHKKSNNVVSTNLNDIENINEKFDYIVLIGLEDITKFNKIKSLLNSEGKLLIAMDNKYSVKNLSTKNGIDKLLNNESKMFTLESVMKALKEAGFINKKFYYPLTDYKFANVILTDDKEIAESEISRNIVYNTEDNIKFYEENELINQLFKDGVDIKYFANSYLIEVFNGEYIENDIKLIAFSNMRKDEYKIKTIVKKDFVYKYPDSEKSVQHINNIKRNIDIIANSKLKTIDTYDDEKIISKYVENDTFDEVILKTLKNDKNQAVELIKKFKQNLVENMELGSKDNNVFDKFNIKYDTEIISNLHFVKYGLWDLIFQNCFYIDGEFYFYDQEWMEENLPIDFILYRSIKYFVKIRKYIQVEELYEILNISKETIQLFEELDNKIQEKTRNNEIWKLQKNGKNLEQIRIQKLTDNHTINLLNIEIENKKGEIENKNKEIVECKKAIDQLRTDYGKVKDELNIIYSSKSWKITKPLRKIRGKL